MTFRVAGKLAAHFGVPVGSLLSEDQQTDAYFEAQETEEAALAVAESATDRAYANRDDRAEQPDDARDEAIRLRRSM